MNEEAQREAKKLIAKFEGCQLKAYKCPVGKWTIGYGHTKGVKAGDVWTQKQADEALTKEIEEYGKGVLQACPSLAETPNRLAACISLAYNIGTGAFCRSTLVKKLNAKDYAGACEEIKRFNRAGGKVLSGLTRRRQKEYRLCKGETT